jgi:hypothetical protein
LSREVDDGKTNLIQQNVGAKDCSDKATSGTKSTMYDYVVKSQTGDTDYPTEACTPYLHGNMQVDNIQINNNITTVGNVVATGTVGSAGVTVFTGASCTLTGAITAASASAGVKAFNIPHPTKEGKRLWHGCLEGPEYGVYVRGRLKDGNVIELPEYWKTCRP